MKEPYWSFKKNKGLAKEAGYTIKKFFFIWLKYQIITFYQLHFKSCKKQHFWGDNLYCLRCKRPKRDIDKETKRGSKG